MMQETRRRGAQRGGGRLQRVPVKFIEYGKKTETRETTKNSDLTGNFKENVRVQRKPKMIPWWIRTFSY